MAISPRDHPPSKTVVFERRTPQLCDRVGAPEFPKIRSSRHGQPLRVCHLGGMRPDPRPSFDLAFRWFRANHLDWSVLLPARCCQLRQQRVRAISSLAAGTIPKNAWQKEMKHLYGFYRRHLVLESPLAKLLEREPIRRV